MRTLARFTALSGLALAALMGSASIASAAPPEEYTGNPTASCVGIIASEHAQTDGGADENVRNGKEFAAFLDLHSYGELVRFSALEHLGTHALCGRE